MTLESCNLGQLVLPERRELVLDYIVERKRMDDLCSSIKDGRFKEQKVRFVKFVHDNDNSEYKQHFRFYD